MLKMRPYKAEIALFGIHILVSGALLERRSVFISAAVAYAFTFKLVDLLLERVYLSLHTVVLYGKLAYTFFCFYL